MKIAICDDDSQDLLRIASLVESYRNIHKADLTYISFQSAAELLFSMERTDYDVLFLGSPFISYQFAMGTGTASG